MYYKREAERLYRPGRKDWRQRLEHRTRDGYGLQDFPKLQARERGRSRSNNKTRSWSRSRSTPKTSSTGSPRAQGGGGFQSPKGKSNVNGAAGPLQKGIVRGVDADLSPAETLERLSGTGVIAVYRCNRVVDNKRVPTESVIATFAGTSCPSELKVWPLVFRVEPLASRPIQCRNCWRYGHSMAGCKSRQRCCACGGEHAQNDCNAQEERCCLCDGNHPANYLNCSVRAQELQVIEIIDRRRCSRMEAVNIVKERASGYAGTIGRQNLTTDRSLTATIEAAVEKAVAKAMERDLKQELTASNFWDSVAWAS
ncbi:uncharacterized protein [Dermacentor andersoni]|uniref:uncharacterized protein n=1 Tax=Dermacentor andersoni TaxID=34620 RepID=UPI003B3AA736